MDPNQKNIPECDLPNYGLSGDRNLQLGGIPCIMSKGRGVRDEDAMRAFGCESSASYRYEGSIRPLPVCPESSRLDIFMYQLRQIVRKDRRTFFVNGVPYMASINWLRDHVHEMKAYKHWETDLTGYLGFAVDHQHPKGFFHEIIKPLDDPHAGFVDRDCLWVDEKHHLVFIRLELEADVEYLVIEGATQAFKATGDEKWIRKILPALSRAVDYCTSDPKRWDPVHGLVKRCFTIDTWDFTYGASSSNRRIEPGSPMSIMHGDNSGLYQAMRQLAWLNGRLGQDGEKSQWEQRAARLKESLDRTCWNGRYYTHEVHLNHPGNPMADERAILSLSNAYALNRGVTTFDQTQSILDEYQARRKTSGAFAEWFSIDPPYDRFGDHPAGSYINGGIASFTAGELARAAFKNGREAYGWDILTRLQALVERDDTLYFLYDPVTGKNLGGGPSGWGAAAILAAVDEGLAGIEDTGVCFDQMAFSPRWPVTGMNCVRYITGYECSKTLVETRYNDLGDQLAYQIAAPSREISCHILLPFDRTRCEGVTCNGRPMDYRITKVNHSVYADFSYIRKGSAYPREKWPAQEFDDIRIILRS